jgi:hypothetical protein
MRQCAKHCRHKVLIGKKSPKNVFTDQDKSAKKNFSSPQPGDPTSLIHARKTVSNVAS